MISKIWDLMLNCIPPDRLVMLARHAESEKNILDYHGHSDLDHPLTPSGLSCARDFGRLLRRRIVLAELVASSSLSSRQTAMAIAESHHIGGVQIHEQLHAVGMGIIAGLTDSEVKAQFPHIHEQLRMFQEGVLHPKDLEIPGRESFMDFATRIHAEINFLTSRARPLLVIAHHSTLNMLMHVAAVTDGRFDNAPYQRFQFPNLSVTLIEIGDNRNECWQIRGVALVPDAVEEW